MSTVYHKLTGAGPACQLETAAASRSSGPSHRSSCDSTDSGCPRTTSSPKLVMYACNRAGPPARGSAALPPRLPAHIVQVPRELTPPNGTTGAWPRSGPRQMSALTLK